MSLHHFSAFRWCDRSGDWHHGFPDKGCDYVKVEGHDWEHDDWKDCTKELDGYVEGTGGNDVIDTGYTGDPEGDMIDNNDAIIAGEGPQDDIVYAYGGDDTVSSAEGDDTVFGGDGNDTIHTGTGDDYVEGGTGDDSVYLEDGNDIAYGGDGNDSMYGGEGDDLISGDAGDDSIYGGDGNDTLNGDDGEDSIFGGAGMDTITGGNEADAMYGGADEDTFKGGSDGDYVDGGEGYSGGDPTRDYDTLDLTGMGPLHVNYDSSNPENGTVDFLDGSGNVTGSMTFENIENVIPCFTPGSLIATPKGERAVEDLRVGDKVITRDNGIQEIRWVGTKVLDWRQLSAEPHLRPVLIRKGALGHGLPERDMLVSPNHRVLVANDQTQLYFEEREVLVAAKHLVNNAGVSVAESLGTSYIHFMFDHHEVVLSDGAWTESFQPGDYTMKGIGNAQRAEILSLFPELRADGGLEGYTAARRTLKKHEAQMLMK